MSSRRRRGGFLLAVILAGQFGCSMMPYGSDAVHETLRTSKPRSGGYRDHTSEQQEDWEEYGRSARSDRPVDKENDPFRDLLTSPKARSIERSLGYD